MTSNRLSAHMASAPVRVFDAVHAFRVWRKACLQQGKSVGFVPTMGALHEGHLQLVDASLHENDLTVVSIFVNPAQFAPHEDLANYPRTLPSDLALLAERQERAHLSDRLVVLVPQVLDMYPNGITQNVDAQVGAFVEVKGLSHQMEGGTRPTFFRGVATVVTKLFNVVLVRMPYLHQPDRAYFGQKDIQQAIILRRLVDDLLFTYPDGSKNVRVLPTARDPIDHLALSSRNKYLDENGRRIAPLLYQALTQGQAMWDVLVRQNVPGNERVTRTLEAARSVIVQQGGADPTASAELDYISLNDPVTLDELTPNSEVGTEAILSGAVWVRNHRDDAQPAARLIDNVLLGFVLH
ncbi:pantoate--beta-alanine ligase (AMP-forming) [Malassezia nana]|uniref:Pantoate--beta-alanine ligase n=1 Tax=Malassezia nana TaxID=180528 RepID=A0AAF0EJ62_9BASI|nr:pantoate--beta-alanine ligase (AMP-forming) [Malassezia nana]